MKDILQDKSLKKMPFSTPEGYFEELKAELKRLQEYYDDPIRKEFVIE